jgi:AraC-like DNA-binding protein
MRLVYQDDFRPLAVELAHASPGPSDEPYIRFFGAPVRFGCDAVTLILPSTDVVVPLRGACPELAQFHDDLATKRLAEVERGDVVANVRARIVELLPSGRCDKGTIATALSMSGSALQQRLIERRTGFREVLNDIRRELACSHLRQSGVSVTEIAFLLGFNDVSNFTRAFKRWTGTSPTRFREQA